MNSGSIPAERPNPFVCSSVEERGASNAETGSSIPSRRAISEDDMRLIRKTIDKHREVLVRLRDR